MYAKVIVMLMIWITPIAAQATNITYIDKRVRTEPLEYAVVFAAYSGVPGHAFAILIRGDAVQNATLQSGAGFYPSKFKDKLSLDFDGQGILKDDTWKKSDVVLSVLVNKENYERAAATVAKWKKPTPYYLGFNDCTTFVQEMAQAIGLTTPKRFFAPLPIMYVEDLVSLNK